MRLKICETLRTASLNPKFTGSYKKVYSCPFDYLCALERGGLQIH